MFYQKLQKSFLVSRNPTFSPSQFDKDLKKEVPNVIKKEEARNVIKKKEVPNVIKKEEAPNVIKKRKGS